MQEEQNQIDEATRARIAGTTTAETNSARSIIKRPSTPGVPVQHYSVVDMATGRDIEELLTERVNACSIGVKPEEDHVTVGVASKAKVTKPTRQSEERRTRAELQKKVEAEARLAMPRARR